MRIYVQLDVDYFDNAKVISAGERAEIAYVRGLAFCKRVLSDGIITDAQLQRLALPGIAQRAAKLVEVGLWERVDGGYLVVGWSERNKLADEICQVSERRATAGRIGGHRSGEARRRSKVEATASHSSKQVASTCLNTETETETETETTPAPASNDATAGDLWRTMCAVCGIDDTSITRSARGAYNKALSELRASGATADELRSRAARWPYQANLTPPALARHWAELGPRSAAPTTESTYRSYARSPRERLEGSLAAALRAGDSDLAAELRAGLEAIGHPDDDDASPMRHPVR